MYFKFFELHSWGKRSADSRRRFNQRLLKGSWPNGPEGIRTQQISEHLVIYSYTTQSPQSASLAPPLRSKGRFLFP